MAVNTNIRYEIWIAHGCDDIVGTSFWNDIMPLIRSCTNDFGTIDEFGSDPTITRYGQELLLDRNGNRTIGSYSLDM